ncbi:hypothetical protein GCM10023095_24830 [Pseudaeromonas paramecii]|uniref:Uncharacterized protein n=1 Tax=Pseudaeromonas paramecii TaxID=2138166 RepID=A0ABP8QDE6_9GAMM
MRLVIALYDIPITMYKLNQYWQVGLTEYNEAQRLPRGGYTRQVNRYFIIHFLTDKAATVLKSVLGKRWASQAQPNLWLLSTLLVQRWCNLCQVLGFFEK